MVGKFRTLAIGYHSFLIVLFLVFIVSFAFRGVVLSVTGFTYDDAWIALRVARNLADHGQLVFNLGEHLQTATSNLYALLLAFTYKMVGDGDAVLGVWRWIGVVADSLTAVIVYLLIAGDAVYSEASDNKGKAIDYAALTGGMFYAGLSTSIIPAVGGLETPIFVFSVALFFLLLQKGWLETAVLVGILSVLLRPEGALVFLISLMACAWRYCIDRKAFRLKLAMLAILTFALYELAVVFYFGSLIPQTAIAKALTRGEAGAQWLALLKPLYFSLATAPLAILSLMGVVRLLLRRSDLYPLVLFTVGYSAFISVFGSWWPWYKPPVMLFYAVTIGLGCRWIFVAISPERHSGIVSFAIFSLMIVTFAGVGVKTVYAARALLHSPYITMVELSDWIVSNVSEDKVVMLEPLGVFGYHVPHKVYDYPGLASSQVTDSLARIPPPRDRSPADPRVFPAVVADVKPSVIILRDAEFFATEQALRDLDYHDVHQCGTRAQNMEGEQVYPFHVLVHE